MRRPLVAAAVLAALSCAWPVFGDDDDEPRKPTIAVSGQGKISAAPDVAHITMGVVTNGETARQALSANSEVMASLIEQLKQHGIAAKDIQTSQIEVNPRYSQPAPGRNPAPHAEEFVPRIVGYHVSNRVQVTSRDISKLGAVLDAVVKAGANQMHGISFGVNEPEKLLDEARKRAMADAKHKAELLAGEAGVVLGAPISITESAESPPPRPEVMFRAAAASAAVPVAAGEQELRVNVHAVYELKPAK